MTDYSQHPKSLSEVRADKSRNGSDWTPRDVLIQTLRQIDSGELDPAAMIVVYSHKPNPDAPSDNTMGFSVSSPDFLHSLGLAMWLTSRLFETRDN
jgi:hypothetical protein